MITLKLKSSFRHAKAGAYTEEEIEDSITIFYLIFAYTLILFFTGNLFIKWLWIIVFAIWGGICLIKKQFTLPIVVTCLVTILLVFVICELILNGFDTKHISQHLLICKIIITECLMTLLVFQGLLLFCNLKSFVL